MSRRRDIRQRQASGERHVDFMEGLVSGQSGSGKPTRASVSDSELDDSRDHDDVDMADEQLQEEMFGTSTQTTWASKSSNASTDVNAYWESIQPFAETIPLIDSGCKAKDNRVFQGMDFLVDEVAHFATKYANLVTMPRSGARSKYLDGLLVQQNKELIRYIGCIAIGGPRGSEGWEDLVQNARCREALVIGIIGRALQEHVFSELYFGGGDALKKYLNDLQMNEVGDDGFSRTNSRADAIRDNEMERPGDFEASVNTVTAKLLSMLSAFLFDDTKRSKMMDKCLRSIVYHAGSLARQMRTISDIVYYWPPTFKDEEFEPARMEAYNIEEMVETSPYKKQDINGHTRAILTKGQEDRSEAIVRVVCFPGLVAYRQFGGALARHEIALEKRGLPVPADVQESRRRGGEQPLNENQGIRSRVLWKSLVLLQWGKQRLLTREAGTSTHIDAVRDDNMKRYTDDNVGFVELYDLALNRWKADE